MIKIRDATLDDVPAIVALLQQLSRDGSVRERDGADPVYARAFAAIVSDPRQRIVVAEDAGVVVGTATLRVFANLSHAGRSVAQAESVVVDERARGRGVGALLMKHLEDTARSLGCFRCELTSNRERTDAHRFYERLGYRASHVGFKKPL